MLEKNLNFELITSFIRSIEFSPQSLDKRSCIVGDLFIMKFTIGEVSKQS